MKNIVLFRLSDDDSIWLADLEAGTVERAEAFDMDDDSSPRGAEVTAAAGSRSEAASHYLYPSRGGDVIKTTESRPEAASHYLYPSREGDVIKTTESR